MGLNDKYRAGYNFYFTDKQGNHMTTDLAGRNSVPADMVEDVPSRFTDSDGREYRVPHWELKDFMRNNISEGRNVRAMEEWTLPGNSRNGADNVWVSAFDDARKEELRSRGWKLASEAEPGIIDTIFYGMSADDWRAPVNRGPDGKGDVVEDIKYHAENIGRGAAGAYTAAAVGVPKMIADLTTSGGAFVADALGASGTAAGLRESKREIDELAGKTLDWTVDNVMGDAFFNQGDGTRDMVKVGLKAAETVGGLYSLGKAVQYGGEGIQAVAGALGKTVETTTAATTAMATMMGAEGYEGTISDAEERNKITLSDLVTGEAEKKHGLTSRDYLAAAINGTVSAVIAPLYGKVSGLIGKEEAARAIQKSYADMLKAAAVDVAEGAVLGGAQAAGGEIANAVQTGEIQEGAAKRVMTAAAVGGALVGATKVPGALGGWVRQNRINYAKAATMQGENALAATRAGMPLERSRWSTDDVRAVTQNNEVIFQDGTVYVPARKIPSQSRELIVQGASGSVLAETTISDPKIILCDGTILSPAGKVIGVRATKLGYTNEIRGEAATPAEAVYRQVDPEAPYKFRVIDPTTGESIENGALAGLEPPESARNWFAAKARGENPPELDADGVAYTALWQQAHSVNPEISRAAQLALEQVAAGRMNYRQAAEVVDSAIEQTRGWQYSIYGQLKRGGAVKPEAAAGTDAERAAEPIRTDLPALSDAAEAPRMDGAMPKATTANANMLLGYVADGTIAPTEIPTTKIAPAGEMQTVSGAAIIVRQNLDGTFTAITGGDKIEEAKQDGAKAVKAIVVKEEDGWTEQTSQAIALVDALKNGTTTPAETIKAIGKLGLSDEDVRDINAATPDTAWAVKAASELSPMAIEKLDDSNVTTIGEIGNVVNVRSVGMNWQATQEKLIDTMPTGADADVASIAGTIAVNAPEMDGVAIWNLAEWANVHAENPAINDALNSGEQGIKTLEEMMGKDDAGTVPVEQPDGELKTVNQVEAESPKPVVEMPVSAPVDHSLDLVPVDGKDGAFHCAAFPEVELTFQNGVQYVSGLTATNMLDSRNRYEMGRFLSGLADKASEGGYEVAFEDGALVEVANDLVENYQIEGRERAMTARAKSVGKVLLKSGLANEIVVDRDRFDQALREYPEGVRLAKDGKTWGFFSPRDGKVYLNGSLKGTRTFLNTTIHEFAHPAVMATREANPELYNRGMELIVDTDYYKTVKGHEDYAGMSERSIREEALVRLLSDRLEDIKAKVPAKIYKEIEEFVNAFWRRFGEANGIADLTPAMVQTMTIEDIADAIGAEMQSGRKFGAKPLDVQANILKVKIDRLNSSKITSQEHHKAWMEIRRAWKSLNEQQKTALESWSRGDAILADQFAQLRNYDQWRAKTSEAVKQRLKKSPNKSQEDFIRSSREWYLANGTMNGMTPWAYLVSGHKLHIPEKGDEGYDWFHNFFDGMDGKTKREWKILLGGKDYAAGGGVSADLAIRDWRMWARGANQMDGFDPDDDTAVSFEDFMDAVVAEEDAYQKWKESGKLSIDERQELIERESGNVQADNGLTADDYVTVDGDDTDFLPANRPAFAMSDSEQVNTFGSVAEDMDLKPYRAGEIQMFQAAKDANAKRGLVPFGVMQQAGQDRARMVTALNEMDGLNLPEDVPGKTSFGNASYGKTMENTTVCTRSLGIRSLTDKVADYLRRPLTVEEQLYIAQDAFNYTDNPQCLYCYVAMDRMAKAEYFGRYVDQMNAAMAALKKGVKPAKVYKHFLDGRKDTPVMRARFRMWKELVDKGGQVITKKDVASEDMRAKVAASDPVLALQLKDAEKYAQSASWAKKVAPYRAYNGEILKWSDNVIRHLNSMYGIRFHSFSEASPAFIHEKMQMITDAAVRGAKGLEYTKEPWEVEVFANTGMNFNIGTFAMHDPDPKTGEYLCDGMQGMDWEKAKGLRSRFPGVSVVFVAVNDDQVEWAGKQDWIDIIIPYHIVRTGDSVAKMMGWKNYKEAQEDIKGLGWTEKDKKAIYPSEHNNDRETYFRLLKQNHLEPRFKQWVNRPWYMKLVNETRRASKDTPALQPIFNIDAAYDALDMMQNRGGYFERIGVTEARESEIAGKMAKAINGGAKPRPAGGLRLARGASGAGVFRAGRVSDGLKLARPGAARSVFVAGRARVAEPGDQGEQTPGTFAASRELGNQRPLPVTAYGQIHRIALPVSEMEWLRKKLTGDVSPAHVGRPANGAIASSTKSGKIVIEADVFGTVDKTDMANEKALLQAHGFFRNEDPTWCAGQQPGAIRAERERSEDQLATQLLNLGKRRTEGRADGGQGAARGAFAAEVAKIVMDMPDVPAGTTIGRVRTIGQGVRDYITAQIMYGGGTTASAEASMRHEAGQFLDWCYGGPVVVDPATGATDSRGNTMNLNQLTSEMFGKFLIMPNELEQRAPDWSAAIMNAITSNPKLTDAWKELTVRGMSEQAYAHVAAQIAASQAKDHERALAKITYEGTEPIKAGNALTNLKEQIIIGMHDTLGPIYIRINEAKKRQIAIKKQMMRGLTPAQRAAVQADIDRFIGIVATDLNKLELARTAWERGSWNEGRRYTIKMLMALNSMTERDGNTIEDLSMYDNMQRVIETQGRAGSFGINPRQAQLTLDDMQRRLGPERWSKLEATDRMIHSIIEQEVLNDPRFEQMFGAGFANYCRSQTHYVTTKRIFSPEELDAIEQARTQVRRMGVAGGDDVVSQMYAYGSKCGAAADVGEANWTASLKGSMSASQEALSATFAKHMALMNAVRRNDFVIKLREAMMASGVTGVRDMKRVDGGNYPENKRYGHINYMENGQKRVLIVPRQIADGFKTDAGGVSLITKINSICRSLYIDYNVAYWNQNINRNNGSIEKNMPGMSEPWAQTIARPLLPGVNKIGMLTLEHIIRHLPEKVSLPLRMMLGQHTPYFFIPQAKRWADLLMNPSAWQQKLWAAEDAGDIATVTEMRQDLDGVMQMLNGNMFVPSHHAYTAGETKGFLEDVFDQKGLKLIETMRNDQSSRGSFGRFVDAFNVFKKNQAQQEWEDVLAKTKAYLHDRMMFGAQRTVAETGDLVKKNVSIAEGERHGSNKSWIQRWFAQFFNMCEKGNVRHFKAYKDRPGETIAKAARVWIGRIIGGLLTSGVIAKIMLDDDDVQGDVEKAKEKFGDAWEYARFMYRSSQNVSKYTKINAEYQPIWLSEDGNTSIVLAAPLNDEDKIITPTADAVVQTIAHEMGIGKDPTWGDAVVNSTIKAVTPDMQAATPAVTLGKTIIAAMTDYNPPDLFRGAPMFDEDLHANKFMSSEDLKEFGIEAGMRLWNDFGGRAIIQAPVNGVDNGRGSASKSLENALRYIPILSPAIGRFVKIQVGSPAKQGEVITERREKQAAAVRLCAKRLLQMSDMGIHNANPELYEAKIAEWTETYGLSPFEVKQMRVKYLNANNMRNNREAFDRKELQRLKIEARKQGRDEEDIWLMLGE